MKASPDGKVPPESRIFLQIIGYIATAIGLIMFGWFCQHKLHPALVLFASAVGTSQPPFLPQSPVPPANPTQPASACPGCSSRALAT